MQPLKVKGYQNSLQGSSFNQQKPQVGVTAMNLGYLANRESLSRRLRSENADRAILGLPKTPEEARVYLGTDKPVAQNIQPAPRNVGQLTSQGRSRGDLPYSSGKGMSSSVFSRLRGILGR